MANPLVSVVIPTYNRAHLITDALDSVWNQSYRPIEVILVDDGSTDTTEEVVSQWQREFSGEAIDFKLHYIRQTNAGGNPARNRGIKASNGTYIAFLDSDDAWLPNKLCQQIPRFNQPEIGAVYCGVQHMDFETGERLEPIKRVYPEGHLLEKMLIRDVTAQTSAYVVRREAFEQVGRFDESLLARQDWDMWIRLAEKYQIASIPVPLVLFREHNGIRTASHPEKELKAYRAIRCKYSKLLKSMNLACRLQARSAYYKRMGRVYHKHNLSLTKAYMYAILAITCWPFDFDGYAALAGMALPSKIRQSIHRTWNKIFGATPWAIRSH